MMQSIVTPWSLLTATGALLAFHFGLYTLVGRERKSPYVINSVFWLFLLCMVAAAFDIAAALLRGRAQEWLLLTGAALLLVAVVWTICVVYRIAIRFVYFIDDPHPNTGQESGNFEHGGVAPRMSRLTRTMYYPSPMQ